MAKIRAWRRGLKAGNRPLSVTEGTTLEHISYNKETNQVEADVPLQTTLNSFYLGGQHKISSGGENIFFTNLGSNINFFPVWQGLRDHRGQKNHGPEGVLKATTRTYDEITTVGPLALEQLPREEVLAVTTGTFGFNVSVHGVTVVLTEDLTDETSIRIDAYVNGSTTITYQQELPILKEHHAGEELTLMFEHPFEFFATDIIRAELNVIHDLEVDPVHVHEELDEELHDHDEPHYLAVTQSVTGEPYLIFHFRSFQDEFIVTETMMKEALAEAPQHPVYLVNVVALDVGSSVTLDRLEAPNDAVVQDIVTGSTRIRIELEWDRNIAYEGIVLVNGVEVLDPIQNGGTYTGSVELDIDTETTAVIIERNGEVFSTPLELSAAPVIESIEFVTSTNSGYPGTQTELKQGDNVTLHITTDIPVSEIEFLGGLRTLGVQPVSNSNNFEITYTVTDTTARLNIPLLMSQEVRVRSVAYSQPATTINQLNHNNQYPLLAWGATSYPVAQQALKDNEAASSSNTAVHYDTIAYTSPNSELSVSNTATFENPKRTTRLAGTYNITVPNLMEQAVRNANNASSSASTVVWIAHQAPTININRTPVMRSGGNDSTQVQPYIVSVVANQRVLNKPFTLQAGNGTLSGGWTYFTNRFDSTINIHDTDPRGPSTFSGLSITNLAGVEVTAATTMGYSIKGFVTRTVPVDHFGTTASINVSVVTVGDLRASWSANTSPFDYVAHTNSPTVNSYNLTTGGAITLLDKSATDASSQTSHITIEEL